jgi:hypothetical protein
MLPISSTFAVQRYHLLLWHIYKLLTVSALTPGKEWRKVHYYSIRPDHPKQQFKVQLTCYVL